MSTEFPIENNPRTMQSLFSEADISGALPPRPVTPNTAESPELKRARELEVSRRKPKAKRKTRKNRKR